MSDPCLGIQNLFSFVTGLFRASRIDTVKSVANIVPNIPVVESVCIRMRLSSKFLGLSHIEMSRSGTGIVLALCKEGEYVRSTLRGGDCRGVPYFILGSCLGRPRERVSLYFFITLAFIH